MQDRDIDHGQANPRFLSAGGDMGALMRGYDWTATLHAPQRWPIGLQAAAGLMLKSKFPMFILWGDEQICLYNDSYIPLLGQRHPSALGVPFRQTWPEIWDQVSPWIDRTMAGESLEFDSLPLTLERNGYPEQGYFTFCYSPLYDDSDAVTGLFCACYETTDKVEALSRLSASQAALAKANANLEARVTRQTRDRDRVWRLSRDIIAVGDGTGSLKSVNPAFGVLLGWSSDDLATTPFIELVHPEQKEQVSALFEQLDRGETVSQIEIRNRHKDGTFRWISWTIVPDGGELYLMGRDVSADKDRQTALAVAEDALRQSQKMEAVGQLTGGIAHDFNNLLTGIMGSLEMMQRRAGQGRSMDVQHFAVAAMTSANRAAALTHRLLAFSRRQSLDPKAVDSNHLVTGMGELFRRTIGESIRLEIVSAGGLWLTRCDPHQLESSLLNLVINARDAMPDGGTLTIETANAHLDQAYAATARDVSPGQYVCISVTDTGTGMSADTVAKAFDPFFTTKPIGQGTGLGLSMIYGFARQSEGYAKIYSELGHGTTVKMYLPRDLQKKPDRDSPAFHRAVPGVTADEIVMVVEDEATVRDLVIDVLDDLGYRALEAHDGPSGLRILQSDVRIDLLITDVGLPGLNGRQLADAALALRPGLKILFMTGYAHNAAAGKDLLGPGMEIITKPFAIDALATRIAKIMETER